MARWTGTWLGGLAAAGVQPADPDSWRGRRLGLAPGQIATVGPRIGAFAVDALASGLVAALFVPDRYDPTRGVVGMAVLAVENIVLLLLTGQTFGMRLLGLRVAPVPLRAAEQDTRPSFLGVCLRTALLLLLVPALISDRDGRGLHDRAGGTAVLRSKGVRSFATGEH